MPSLLLTETIVEQATAPAGIEVFPLSDGVLAECELCLFVWKTEKVWTVKYRFQNKRQILNLGVYPQLSLADARTRTDEIRAQLAQERDPKAVKQQQDDETKNRCVLNDGALSHIANTTLFYPCSGNDLSVPLQLFAPVVTEFWFVDKGYFSPGDQATRNTGLDAPADQQKPLLEGHQDYRLLAAPTISGPPRWPPHQGEIEPCVLTERYQHLPSSRSVTIHRRRGYGISAFRKEISTLGVFFYRGDSQGEGGSGNLWLAPDHVPRICDKLIDGGLIVTDGSQYGNGRNSSLRGAYHQFAQYHWIRPQKIIPEAIIASVTPFTDKNARCFTCVGYAGYRYGPTLIWKMQKSAQHIA